MNGMEEAGLASGPLSKNIDHNAAPALQPIFQAEDGHPVKFFIQRDIVPEIQAELSDLITNLGGKIEIKVPRAGFILTQPKTPEEARLRECWLTPDRPDRHFVPYTYVEECRTSGMLLKQIFLQDGQPLRMHIHKSIANGNAREVLGRRIVHSGGEVTNKVDTAQVILADPSTEIFAHLVKIYNGVPDKSIESYLWVKKCIERGAVLFTPLVYKNPGGRRAGEERTAFTEEDEERLCRWIASKIPYKETGGRTGNRLYQQLCELSGDPEYNWVTRHTWQSWRERYKKNSTRLDNLISTIVDQKKPALGERGQYGYVRKVEKPAKKRSPQKRQGPINAEQGANGGPSNPIYEETRSLPLSQSHPPSSPSDNQEEETQWRVRIGQEPPPPWAVGSPTKRKAFEEPEGSKDAVKRHQSSQSQTSSQALDHSPDIHMIDQTLRDIAKETRFTVEEVKEYYDKCGEMGRTRTRFVTMRHKLTEFFQNIP